MLLAIDIGNTNITIGVGDSAVNAPWKQQWRLSTRPYKTTDEYGVALKAILREFKLENAVNAVVICSVAPPLTAAFTALSREYLGHNPLLIENSVSGVAIKTDNPAEVGVDRIVNAAAAHAITAGPTIVVDMGTATKFDVVAANGDFLGGVIAPGLQLAADALAGRAAQLKNVALEAPPHAIGRNTIHAMQSGLIFGYTGLIEGIIQRLKNEHPKQQEPLTVLGTGGMIGLIAAHTAVIDRIDPSLTLSGMRVVYNRIHGQIVTKPPKKENLL